jgi:membrane associated rhomboid family serine protease
MPEGRMPPVTQALLIANGLVFVLQYLAGPILFSSFALWPPASELYPNAPSFRPWQLLTYGFLHAGLAHLFFNMFALYMFGSDLERLFGSRFFAAYYFVSVLAAAICHLVVTSWMGAEPYPTVGASGGVYGLLLAYGIYFPNRQLMLLFPPIPMRARTFVVVFAVLELVLGVTGTAAGVAHFAHLGGMLGGYLMIRYRRGVRTR